MVYLIFRFIEACDIDSNDEEAVENPNAKLSFKSVSLKTFIQKMNNRRRSHMKSIKRIHQRSQLNHNANYDNAVNENSEYYKVRNNSIVFL